MLIDTHVHLDAAEFDDDRDAVLKDVRNAGITSLVVPAVDRQSFDRVTTLAEHHHDIFAALGIHPLYVNDATDDDLLALEHRLSSGRYVAVGEIGLDHFVSNVDRDRQEYFFVAQLKLARRFELPVILHVRRAQDAILKQLRAHPVVGGIAHAFNGSRQQADAFIKLGFKLGFGGAMSFEGSTRIRRLAKELPLDTIVLESDAPDMPPSWLQGMRNTPANVAAYAQILASLRGIPEIDVLTATSANAVSALPRLRSLKS